MKTIRLPQTDSERIHIECFRDDGSSYCVESRRCVSLAVEDNIVDVVLTQLSDGKKRRMSHGWNDDGRRLSFRQHASCVIA